MLLASGGRNLVSLVLLGLAVMLPMLSAMLPVFGYTGQDTLVDMHQIAALLFAGAMVVHTVVSLAARRARRHAP